MEEQELLDDDGYPTEYALEKIKTWNVETLDGFIELMKLIKSIWQYPQDMYESNTKHHAFTLITLGWSGNEDIICAMRQNSRLHLFYWYSSERGGKHVYAPQSYHGS